ncbi:MAG: glycosyltransferase family 39 protein [Spirochaetota bacterium]|nr:glycosyltransferase family 39 protein [Spirochaetota bacterium]
MINSINIIVKDNFVKCLIIVYFLLHIPHFILPLSGGHRWRQTTTASVSRNYVNESLYFFHPRIDVRGDKTGIAGMEFPFYNYLVSIIYQLLGSTWVGFGKSLSFVFAILSLLLLSKIVGYHENNSYVDRTSLNIFFVIISGLLSPYLFRFSSRFMPETLALFFSLLGFYYYYLYINDKSLRYYIVCWFCLTLGTLIRPYFIFFGLPILSRFLFFKGDPIRIRLLIGLLGFLILIPFYIWYYQYVPYLNNRYGIVYFNLGVYNYRDNLLLYLNPFMWMGLLNTIMKYYTEYVLFPFAIIGIYKYFRASYSSVNKKLEFFLKPVSQLLFVGILTLLLLPSIIGEYYILHYYYLAAIFPIFTIGIGYSLQLINIRYPIGYRVILSVISVIIFVSFFHTFRLDKDLILLKRILPEIEQNSKESDLFVVDDAGSSTYLFFINRKGWSVDFTSIKSESLLLEELIKYRDKGAKFAVIKDLDPGENLCGFRMLRLE